MFRAGSFTAAIFEYELSRREHHAGTLDAKVLSAIEDFAPTPLGWSMETGCGKSTILLSNLSRNHHVFAFDDREHDDSSVQFYLECPLLKGDRVTLVPGPTQLTLPKFPFPQPIDFALLDGPHAYPFPELEYYYVYPHLRTGALLVVDDIHIPTIHRLHTFLVEDEMFELVHIERTTSLFRRTTAPTFPPLSDGWHEQVFNKTRFPLDVSVPEEAPRPAAGSPATSDSGARIAELEAQVAELAGQLAWWKEAADARRLKRRLARRLGPLGRSSLFK